MTVYHCDPHLLFSVCPKDLTPYFTNTSSDMFITTLFSAVRDGINLNVLKLMNK